MLQLIQGGAVDRKPTEEELRELEREISELEEEWQADMALQNTLVFQRVPPPHVDTITEAEQPLREKGARLAVLKCKLECLRANKPMTQVAEKEAKNAFHAKFTADLTKRMFGYLERASRN